MGYYYVSAKWGKDSKNLNTSNRRIRVSANSANEAAEKVKKEKENQGFTIEIRGVKEA